MLVEVNRKGETHEDYSPSIGPRSRNCTESDTLPSGLLKGYCLNCGWRPAHVQERGAEIVVHTTFKERLFQEVIKHFE